jgi:hypothetical protein
MDDGRRFHIRPDQSSVLDVPVTILETTMTLAEALEALTKSIGASSRQNVALGMAPINLSLQSTTHLMASGESAREVLTRILDATGRRLSWQLLFDFESSRFVLSVYLLV